VGITLDHYGRGLAAAARTADADFQPRALVYWCATATRELADHTAVDGLCRACGAAWPCVMCKLAALALESL
jgi:hypothetical protein